MCKLSILGIRGVPATHGGFETFAERLSLYLVERGWQVTVYCQEDSSAANIWESEWSGIRRVHIPIQKKGALGTILFDFKAIFHALKENGIFLTLGYNTAIFNLLQRLKGQINIINMDGIEWRREKWGGVARAWFWLNERFGCWVGNHLVADHPQIKKHLATRVSTRKITMIPYGGDDVLNADEGVLHQYGITKENFSIIIARPEPENSILEMVAAFSSKLRNHKLVVLGNFDFQNNSYHKKIKNLASDEVLFLGAIYDAKVVQSLRFFCKYYLHGHKVGGTNPSLVEALGAGCAVIAHDNKFNRWVADEAGLYFSTEADCAQIFDSGLSDNDTIKHMKVFAKARFNEYFTWDSILSQYEVLLSEWYNKN